MIRRLVRLEFTPGGADKFLTEILPHQKHFTRNFKGCTHLEVWRAIYEPDIVYSFSIWNSEEVLNLYRNSDKFKSFWSKAKTLFSQPAQAVSLQQVEVVDVEN